MSGPAPPAVAVSSEIRNRVAIITLNRPEALNALSYEMIMALRSMLEGCEMCIRDSPAPGPSTPP